MKELNRRAFLALTGAAVVALSLAGCDDGPYAPPAPPAPPAPTTSKETELLTAINKVWKEKFEAGLVDHEQLTLNQDAVGVVRAYGRIFETANQTPHKFVDDDNKIILEEHNGLEDKIRNKYGEDSLAGYAGISELYGEDMIALEDEYSCADTAVRTFVAKLLSNSNSAKADSAEAEFISIYLPVVQGKTYMTAIVFLNNKP